MLLLAEPPREQQGALVEFADFRRAVTLRGHQHRAERDQQFQLLMVAAGGLREVAAQRERAAEQAGRLGIRVPVTGLRSRRHIVLNGRFGHAGGFIVGRQLTADGLRIRLVKFFQRARNAVVQKPPPHRTELRVSDFAQPVVGEIVFVPRLVPR